MNFIQIKNLRSLKDTHEIEMKKINVLVGGNSSGKSAFLRIFPLLKQSFSKRINGPILWCGDDDDYVDFGSFKEALNYNAYKNDGTIRFIFDFFADFRFRVISNEAVIQRKMSGNVKVEFAISNNKETTYDYVSELILEYKNYHLDVSISDENKIAMLKLNDNSIDIIRQADDFYDKLYDAGMFGIALYDISQTARKEIKEFLNLEDDEKLNQRVGVLYNVLEDDEKDTGMSDDNEIYKKVAYEEKYNPQKVLKLKEWVYLYYLPDFFNSISDYIKGYFQNVYYIAPVRATAERYYKLRNLAVDEVDCRGKNLPVFLKSLSRSSFCSFQEWTLDNLGFKVLISVSEGHVSLKIQKEGQAKAVNLSDTGFGYSQILPIVTQLWFIRTEIGEKKEPRAKNINCNIPKTIVIEQPELHLHPALQAKLIDIIAKVAKEGNIHFIIETHSETMVNRIGTLINRKKIENDDVGIVIFNKEFGDDETQISKSSFDDEGYLENWPIGFFEPEEE